MISELGLKIVDFENMLKIRCATAADVFTMNVVCILSFDKLQWIKEVVGV